VRTRLLVVISSLAFVAAACAGSGNPEDYDQTVQDNFIEGCVASGSDDDTEAQAGLVAVCECAYAEISTTISYAEFKEFDDTLRENIDAAFPDQFSQIFADCIRNAS